METTVPERTPQGEARRRERSDRSGASPWGGKSHLKKGGKSAPPATGKSPLQFGG